MAPLTEVKKYRFRKLILAGAFFKTVVVVPETLVYQQVGCL